MTPAGLQTVLDAARKVWEKNPDVLEPVGKAFDVDVEERLFDPACCQELRY
jgi:hypothetical protein